jgi:hypothetical protein
MSPFEPFGFVNRGAMFLTSDMGHMPTTMDMTSADN